MRPEEESWKILRRLPREAPEDWLARLEWIDPGSLPEPARSRRELFIAFAKDLVRSGSARTRPKARPTDPAPLEPRDPEGLRPPRGTPVARKTPDQGPPERPGREEGHVGGTEDREEGGGGR
jgi:hypothetical protein